MCIWTREELDEQIAAYKKAFLRVSKGKSYTIAGRTLTLQDAAEIRSTLDYLQREYNKLRGHCGPVVVTGRVQR